MALLILLPLTAAAVYLFKTLDAKDGLTSSQVNCILKDGRGYMWFGTSAGLYRYDGYTFRDFQCDSQDGSSLPDSYINTIQEALDGNLWIGTATGYCVYSPQTETFERDMRQVFAKMGIDRVPNIVYIDRHKNIWGAIPRKGIVCFNQQQQLLYEFGYTGDITGVPQGNVCSISECRDGALIVYDDGRIVCCDVMHQQHTVWATSEIADRKLRRSTSLRAFADQMDNIWLYGQGTLFVFNKSTNTWDTTIGDRLGLTNSGVDNSVHGMGSDRNGNIWIGTDQNGLICMNVNTREMEHVQPRNINEGQLMQDVVRIQSIYVDDTDLLWVGTEKSGVAYHGDHIYRFQSRLIGDITAMTQDATGRIWYGTSDHGVLDFDGRLASIKVSCLTTTPDGSLWVGSKSNGLTRIKNGVSTIYSHQQDSVKTLIDDHVNALCTDKVGNLWIATNGGLQVFNPKMNTFSTYTRENGKLTTNTITSLFYAKGNQLIIGTSEGLILMNLSTSEMRHLIGNTTALKKFTNNYITQVYQDSRELLWIGTREGVNILNLTTDDLSYLTEKQGLCNNNICGITEDNKHNIWVTTSNGVSRIVVQRDHEESSFAYGLYNYDTRDGLQSNEFNIGAILTEKNGNVQFGGLYGINWTSQELDEESRSLPRVMLTQLFIGEEEVLIGHEYDGNVLLTQALNESTHLDLNYNQNTFTIKFAAGNYNQSERLQFKYWMEGLDNDWKTGDALKHGVTFHDLGSGTYKLHVKAVSADSSVSNQERVIEIVVAPHWLLSWWMIVIYAIVIIIALYIWRIGIRQVKEIKARKNAVIDQLKVQREEIKAASDDLRQPMIRMTSIISNLSSAEKSLEEREQLNALHSQMLQVITRVSDMQSALENPEVKAKQNVHSRYELNAKGEMQLFENNSNTLTSEVRARRTTDSPTGKFVLIFIDDNEDFLKFINERLINVYDFHIYNNIHKAADDLKTIKADLIVCKEDMPGMRGSQLCNQLKMDASRAKMKFVLMTEGALSPKDMKDMDITLSADDYLAKPFNIQDAVMRFNKLLGLGVVEMDSNLIEGAETRRLESLNSSMTTSTESYDMEGMAPVAASNADDEQQLVETRLKDSNAPATTGNGELVEQITAAMAEETLAEYNSDYSMASAVDQRLLMNIEQYVLQNMSRGQISLEEMSGAMGMGRVPFFHKVRNLTGKTPTELVRDLRLKHACILLKRTNINMSELAVNIGFVTAENFINVFKEKFGLSPLEYRLKHRK
jgi:ligand-binding sensor domain-containing protein/AraC-like DNA-binding protein/DNA-binding NarL/FixJ family response regulator